MRTLGSEAGRSEERAARRPTACRRKAWVRAHRVRFCVWFLSGGGKGFSPNVCMVARTDANRVP